MTEIGPIKLLKAYALGVFPMAESRDDSEIFWVEPKMRGILPLDAFHIPRRLKRTVRSDKFTIRTNTRFASVIDGCASTTAGRRETWINDQIRSLYTQLHAMGHAHSIETWRAQRLVGGLYGVSLGRAFFGESMFSLETDASKVALVHLVARLHLGGFTLLDTQFVTDHLRQFGTVDIPADAYKLLLDDALQGVGEVACLEEPLTGARALQLITQTS